MANAGLFVSQRGIEATDRHADGQSFETPILDPSASEIACKSQVDPYQAKARAE